MHNDELHLLALKIFYSCIKYIELDWVRAKVQHYPLYLFILYVLQGGANISHFAGQRTKLFRRESIEHNISYKRDIYTIVWQWNDYK